MNNNKKKFDISRFSEIKDVTDRVKLPIGGKIKLGVIKVSPRTGEEYPFETEFFVCPPEVRKVFGDEPTEITVFFPIADRKKVFQQSYERYGKNKALQCWGDGITAQRLNLEDGSWEDRKCPCEHLRLGDRTDAKEKRGCAKRGHLRFMIPSVSIGTFYELIVGGTVSFQEINSALMLADKTTAGHWAMIPFRMQRVQKRLKIPGTAKMRAHWVVTLEPTSSLEEIRRVAAGEILYLGQRKGEYEIESPDMSKQVEDEREVVTQGELEEEEKKEAEERGISVEELRETRKIEEIATEETEKKDLRKDIEESRARETQLKKDHGEGKNKLRSYKESKTIYKKRVEEEDKILQAISKKAQEAGIDSFEGLVNFALDQGIFKTQLTEHLATRVLVTNKDVEDRLLKALEELSKSKEEVPKEEISEGDKEKLLANFLGIAQKAGLKNWKEIAAEGCRTRINGEEYIFEIPTTVEEAKEILISDPKRLEKMEEVFAVMAGAIS
ncbi:hypothetical protein ES708_26746 [subsurface metagenome]